MGIKNGHHILGKLFPVLSKVDQVSQGSVIIHLNFFLFDIIRNLDLFFYVLNNTDKRAKIYHIKNKSIFTRNVIFYTCINV